MIRVCVNNRELRLQAPINLQEALATWDYAGKKCAVAVNGEFIPRAAYATTQLQDQDNIDIVAPVGGG